MIADRFVPTVCIEFCERYGADVWARRVRNNFALHLLNLHSFRLVSPDDIKVLLFVIIIYFFVCVCACVHSVVHFLEPLDQLFFVAHDSILKNEKKN